MWSYKRQTIFSTIKKMAPYKPMQYYSVYDTWNCNSNMQTFLFLIWITLYYVRLIQCRHPSIFYKQQN